MYQSGNQLQQLSFIAPLLTLILVVTGCTFNAKKLEGEDYRKPAAPWMTEPVTTTHSPITEPAYRVILIGDAGAPTDDDPTLDTLGTWGNTYKDKTSIVFLGDNLYWQGLTEDDLERGKKVLLKQLEATQASKIYVPGNHDWSFSAETGAATLKRQEDFIEAYPESPTDFLPSMGCPGPEVKVLSQPATVSDKRVVLIALDTHWWLMMNTQWRPGCEAVTTDDITERLKQQLAKHKDDFVIVAAHHPLLSSGLHGGYKRPWLLDFLSWAFEFQQDIGYPLYDGMVNQLSAAMGTNPPEIFAAGHDHSLQVMQGGDVAKYMLISGAGSKKKVTWLTKIPETLFAHGHEGFMVLDFYRTKNADDAEVILRIIEPSEKIDEEPGKEFTEGRVKELGEKDVVGTLRIE